MTLGSQESVTRNPRAFLAAASGWVLRGEMAGAEGPRSTLPSRKCVLGTVLWEAGALLQPRCAAGISTCSTFFRLPVSPVCCWGLGGFLLDLDAFQ